ncbi:HAD family hydrolase [Ornithinibacillus halophilus]|uniref:Phosphoserine phosphatase n=1 Tax=Ornithinibacillus halophilus TaxID=930117 RepID=A0A1M5HTB2_9BACI|nr:HAD family hydrolase [Ornithinibacillus halophilus]SHG19092.1 putative hydrolase of the HAD superfamily [Ornithinibacillus halophilus]
MVKAILFDLDDTLLWDEKSIQSALDATCKIAGEVYSINPVELEMKVRETARGLYASYDTYEFTKKIGINPFEGLWGNFNDDGEDFKRLREIAPEYREKVWTMSLRKMGIDDQEFGQELAETFRAHRKNNPFVFEDTYPVLNHLKDNFQLLLLTNGSPDLQQTKLELSPEIKGYFDHIIVSGEFGSGKPDPEIFDYALSQLDVEREDAMMVGDNLNTDILGANRAEIESVWVNRKQKEHRDIQPSHEIGGLKELLDKL